MATTISEMKDKLRLILKESVDGVSYVQPITPFIWGKPGIGKSEAVKQIADEYGIGFIDLRLSQLESADIRGIPVPDNKDGVCRWLPPEFLPFQGIKSFEGSSGVILLDEFNRARPDVLQAAFQLVLDRQVGTHKILDSWFIVAAGNLGDEDNTDVVEMDAALKNRFIHFRTDVELGPWLKWAETAGVNRDIMTFLSSKPNYLYHINKEGDDVMVTPRSWDKFSKILNQNPDKDPATITAILGPDIISGATGHFMKFLESKEIVSGKDITYSFSNKDVQRKVKSMQRDQIYALCDDVVECIKDIKKVETKHLSNIHDFCEKHLERDIYISFTRKVAHASQDAGNKFIEQYLQKYPEESKDIINIFKNKLS